MKVEVCFSPALYPHYNDNNDKIVIVTDIFRASTTMCEAFKNGVKAIISVAGIEEAKAYKAKGFKVGAERNVKKCDFADFGNAPSDYTEEAVKGQEIVFTTTNGTQAIDVAYSSASHLLIGAFSNLSAVVDFCQKQGKDVLILCAGWQNRFNIEDTLFAGAIVEKLFLNHAYNIESDAARIALSMWKEAKSDVVAYVSKSEHAGRLIQNGLSESIPYCLQIDTLNIVPQFDVSSKKICLK